MPEFHADYIPDGLDDFTSGYLEAAEFTNEEEIRHGFDSEGNELETENEVHGWSPESIAKAIADCAKFQSENAELLAMYYAESGREEQSAGNDFWYSRNGHGVGFFDRGNAPCFDALQSAARKWRDTDVYLSDAGYLELG